MTTKLKDYGITGPWSLQTCEGCGKKRSCMGGNVGSWDDPEYMYFCVLCLIKDVEAMERQMAAEQHWNEQLERGELDV